MIDVLERAHVELIQQAEVIGQLDGIRRFRALRVCMRLNLPAPVTEVPPEFSDRMDTSTAYLKAEAAGYLGAVEDWEHQERIARLFRLPPPPPRWLPTLLLVWSVIAFCAVLCALVSL